MSEHSYGSAIDVNWTVNGGVYGKTVENSELFNVNVPAKALLEAVRSVTNEEEVSLFISDKKVIIALTNTITEGEKMSLLYCGSMIFGQKVGGVSVFKYEDWYSSPAV